MASREPQRGHLCAAAQEPQSPTFHVPTPPPEPVSGEPGPTYVAHDATVWRRSFHGWNVVDAHTAPKLLAVFRADARNTSDWFHARAAELADELEAAIAEAHPMEFAA
jgi:hypothetical protein